MHKFVYDGNPTEVDINNKLSYAIDESDIMTLYEYGYLVDNMQLLPGNSIVVEEGNDDEAAKISIEAKVDNDKGYEILNGLGLDDEQIGKITDSNTEDYKKFVNVLSKARHEVENNEAKDFLRDNLNMTDEQINQLIDTDKDGFEKLVTFIGKSKRITSQDENSETDETDNVDTTTSEEIPENNSEQPVESDPNAQPEEVQQTGEETPSDGAPDIPDTEDNTEPSEFEYQDNQNTAEQPQTDEGGTPQPVEQPADPNQPQQNSNPQDTNQPNNPNIQNQQQGTATEATTLLQLLPQAGTNCFNDKKRMTDYRKLPLHHFHNTIEDFIDNEDAEYTSEVEESVVDVAKRIKGGVELSLYVRKLAIDIAVLNSKYYMAKKYGKNKLKAINIQRKIIKLQKELNKIKKSASFEEKEQIMRLQKEANEVAKKEAKERLKKDTERLNSLIDKNQESGKKKSDTVKDSVDEFNKTKTESVDYQEKYETAKKLYEETGELRYERQMRGFEYRMNQTQDITSSEPVMEKKESEDSSAPMSDDICKKIYDHIIKLLPSNWQKLHFFVGYNNNSYDMKFYYIDSNKKHVDCYEIPSIGKSKVDATFNKIHMIIQKQRRKTSVGDIWSIFTMDVNKDGSFKVNYKFKNKKDSKTVESSFSQEIKKESGETIITNIHSTFEELYNDMEMMTNEIMQPL